MLSMDAGCLLGLALLKLSLSHLFPRHLARWLNLLSLQGCFVDFMELFLGRLASYHEGNRPALAHISKAQATAADLAVHLGMKATVDRGRAIEAAINQFHTLEAVVTRNSQGVEPDGAEDVMVSRTIILKPPVDSAFCTTSGRDQFIGHLPHVREMQRIFLPGGPGRRIEEACSPQWHFFVKQEHRLHGAKEKALSLSMLRWKSWIWKTSEQCPLRIGRAGSSRG